MLHRNRYNALLMCGAAAIGMTAVSGPARAEERDFNIAPQPLATALMEFGSQSGVAVVAPRELTTAKTTRGVSASVEPEAALQAMLAGTGLSYKRDGDLFAIVQGGSEGPQSAGAGGDVDALIVTAQKREENIQDVPIAISAFSQEDLTTRQVAGGPDLMTQVPNMTFTKTNFSSYSIQIRGIGTQAISATTDPAVAVAFNNTPFIRNRFFEQEFYDLQRVEVLRGPQGTLYGRNATAGVVNILSAKPSFRYEAKASADVANYKSSRLEGMVNIPLVEDKAALRLAGAWTKRDGFVTNQITGNPIDGRDLWSTRLSLRFAPTDRVDVNLVWEHFEEDDDRLRSGKQLCKKHVVSELFVPGIPDSGLPDRLLEFDYFDSIPDQGQLGGILSRIQSVFSQGCVPNSLYDADSFQTPNGMSIPYYFQLQAAGLPGSLLDPYVSKEQSRDLRLIESTVDPHYQAETDIAELQATFDLTDTLSLTSETAWGSDSVFSTQDFNRFNTASGAWSIDGQLGPAYVAQGILKPGPNGPIFCDPQIGCADRLVAVDLSTDKSTQFSQELRLGSDFDGPFNFSLGANFLRHDTVAKYYVFINSLGIISSIGGLAGGTGFDWVPGVSTNAGCLPNGPIGPDLTQIYGVPGCTYIDPNPIGSLNDQGHNYFLSKNPYKLISYAVFGEAYYNVTENLKITGGLRWTVDKKEAPRIPSWLLADATVGHPVQDVTEQEWREPTGRLTVDWKPDLSFTDETLIYGSIARGYKAGGANPPPFGLVMYCGSCSEGLAEGFLERSATAPRTFDAEFVNALEVGSKNTLAEGRLTLNLAAFYYDYTGYQISQIVNRSALNLNFDADVWGLEIEADWRPLENLRLGFKGGYENTRVADGERAIDVMDRTAGHEGWSVIRPFPTFPSSCILPTWLYFPTSSNYGPNGVFGLGNPNGGGPGGCELAYVIGVDPVTGLAYEPYPEQTPDSLFSFQQWAPGTYPGFDPSQPDINNGEGFFKDLSGKELPNAPHYTATITADYTLPLPNEWLMTLHTDLYYQSEAWTRIFNTEGHDKLKAYTNVNLAAIFTNEEAGWRIMAYVKNVMDRDSITGSFLNSDDTGLTTNVFLTEPRLYGIRVTTDWSGGPLLGAFGARGVGPYPFTVEIGGQVLRHDAPYEALRPGVLDGFPSVLQPAVQNGDLDGGDGREIRLIYRPGGDWSLAAGARFGRTNSDTARQRLDHIGDSNICAYFPDDILGLAYERCDPESDKYYAGAVGNEKNWSYATARNREEHTIVDFEIGRDAGLGLGLRRSTVGLGLRYGAFGSETAFAMYGVPDWNIVQGWKQGFYPTRPYNPASFHRYETEADADREFEGAGPVLSWEAAMTLLGGDETGRLNLDWTVRAGALFGKQTTSITGEERTGYWTGRYGANGMKVPTFEPAVPIAIDRSESVTVPLVDLSLGLSYSIDRVSVGAGYRWERYFDVLDGGYAEHKDVDRTLDGPYFKVSVGFGG